MKLVQLSGLKKKKKKFTCFVRNQNTRCIFFVPFLWLLLTMKFSQKSKDSNIEPKCVQTTIKQASLCTKYKLFHLTRRKIFTRSSSLMHRWCITGCFSTVKTSSTRPWLMLAWSDDVRLNFLQCSRKQYERVLLALGRASKRLFGKHVHVVQIKRSAPEAAPV